MNNTTTYISQRRVKSKTEIELNPEGVTWLSVDAPRIFLAEPVRESYMTKANRRYYDKKRLQRKLDKQSKEN